MHKNILFASMCMAIGITIPAVWLGLLWYAHSSYDAYIEAIHGPWPFSDMGSGPFVLWSSVLAIGTGIVLILLGFALYKSSRATA